MQTEELTTWQMYRSLLFSVYLPSFLMSVCQGSVLLVIPLFALDLGASVGIAALVFALRGLGNMTFDVPAGFAAARLGDKYTMLVGVGLMSVTGILASQSSTPAQLALSAFFFGASMATWLLARLTYISEAVPSHQRGKAISTMAGLQRFGNLIGPVVSGVVAVQYGFEFVFTGIAVIAGVAFLLVIFVVPANKTSRHDDSPNLLKLIPHIITGHFKIFMTAGIAILFLTVLRAGRSLLIPLWGESINLNASDIGLIMGMAAAVDMTMFPLAGYLMDNRGRKTSAVACLSILSIGILLVPFSTTFWTLAAIAMFTGLGNGLGSGINMTLGADFAPTNERGEFLGVWRLMGDAGSFLGPIAMGQIAVAFALSAAFTLTAGLGMVGVLIMALTVRETLQKKVKEPLR